MNKDMDFNSKKFLIMLLIVCIVFFVVIIKAFEYLPSSESTLKPVSIDNINKPRQVKAEAETPEESEDNTEESEKKTLNVKLPQPKDNFELEEIDAPTGIGVEPSESDENKTSEAKIAEPTPEEKYRNTMYIALQCRNKGQYERALAEYKKIPAIVNDRESIAASYEGIATVYAMNKRYGTALSYATKAFNMSPSSSREMLLARIYYKTGDIEKATKRINNVLHRDFADDK